MRAATSIEEFVKAPVGCWVGAPAFVVWCWNARLSGAVIWGRPSASDFDQLFSIVDRYHNDAVARDVVTDVSQIDTVDPPAYAALLDHMRARRSLYAKHVRRHAIVRFAGLHILSGLAEGFFRLLDPRHDWAVFATASEAFRWTGQPDADSALRDVECIVDGVRGLDPCRRGVRAFLRSHLVDATLAGAARALGVSERSLHRQLGRLGTCFREERMVVRIEEARRLLGESELKIDAIARKVGYTSHAHFAVLFRDAVGKTPAEYRAETRQVVDHMPKHSD